LHAKFDLRLTVQPSSDILADLILGQAIALLDEAFELLTLSIKAGSLSVSLPHFCLILP
jgi:hypothetical protein